MAVSKIESNQAYSDETFKRLDLVDMLVSGAEFSDCRFIGCDFSNAALPQCRFLDCIFQDCSMKLTNVDGATFARVRFVKCNLLGINWSVADWSGLATQMGAVTYEYCDLKYGVFFGLSLTKAVITNCNVREVNFAEADLTDANFAGSDLAGAIFHHTTLIRANFVGARHYTLNISENKTSGARFALPEAIRLLSALDITLVDPATEDQLDDDALSDYIG